ncbi:hypothetical protein STEG23_029692 [Scotinomys teguina]
MERGQHVMEREDAECPFTQTSVTYKNGVCPMVLQRVKETEPEKLASNLPRAKIMYEESTDHVDRRRVIFSVVAVCRYRLRKRAKIS